MTSSQDPFRLAMVGSPDSADVAGPFLDHITPRLRSRGRPVALLCVECSGDFAAAISDFAVHAGWRTAFFAADDLEPLLDCDGVAAAPGSSDHATWAAVELAADLGKQVRVLTGRADPGPVPGARTVRIVSPTAVRRAKAAFPSDEG